MSLASDLPSLKGKTALRFFPFDGHLGYSPVIVQGVVRTALDSDNKPLQASSIVVSVKCIESRIGIRSNLSKVLADYSVTVWSKPDDQPFTEISNLEFPFRITVPTDTPGFTTSVFVEYRCVWRVEAVLHHVPLPGVGQRQLKHYQLPLVSYALPPFHPTPSFTLPPLHHQTHKPGAPSVRYTINPPTTPIGPLDIVSVPIYILPLDPGITIRSATATVERRIQFTDGAATPSTETLTSSCLTLPSSSTVSLQPHALSPTAGESSTSIAPSDDSSNPTITPNTIFPSTSTIAQPLLPPLPGSDASPAASSVIASSIATAQSSGAFTLDPTRGVYSKTLTLQWPESKSHSRWHVGSTLQSDMVSIRFYVRVKITVSHASSSASHTLELSEQELLIVPTNEAERMLTNSHTSDSEHSRSKSKSPRRARRDEGSEADAEPPPVPPVGSSRHKNKPSTSSALPSQPVRQKRKTMKRPHTSSGVVEPSSSLLSPSRPTPTEKNSTPKRWVSANATVPSSRSALATSPAPNRSPTKSFIPFFGAPKVTSIPSGGSSSSAGTALGGSATSMSSEGSGSRSERSDLEEEDDLFDRSATSRSRLWLRGRSNKDHRRSRIGTSADDLGPPPSALQQRQFVSPSSQDPDRTAQIRAWEEELARIEMTSLQNSYAFNSRRHPNRS